MDNQIPDNAQINEAEAESEDTLMPWVWGGIGLLVISKLF